MLTPQISSRRMSEDVPWAADNGRFSNPRKYTDEKFLAWLMKMQPFRDRCLFAVAPDTFGDAEATLRDSVPLLPRIRELGYRTAIVAQPWMTVEHTPWDLIDALFVGGPNEWQHSHQLESLVREAKRRGLWVHMGRVNGIKRMRYAMSIGCDSVDGTFLKFGPDANMPRLQKWLDSLNSHPMLWDDHERKGYRPAKEDV